MPGKPSHVALTTNEEPVSATTNEEPVSATTNAASVTAPQPFNPLPQLDTAERSTGTTTEPPQQLSASLSSSVPVSSEAPRRASASGIRIIGYYPPATASASSQQNVTPDSPEARPSWEIRLAALRARRESASAGRSLQTDLDDTVGVAAASTSPNSPINMISGDDVVSSSTEEVKRTRPQGQRAEFSASPFSSVLSTQESDGDSDTTAPSPAAPAPISASASSALVAPARSSVTVNEEVGSVGSQQSRSTCAAVEGNSLPPLPLAPKTSTASTPSPATADMRHLTSPTTSAGSSVSASFRATPVASPHGVANLERPAVTSIRPTMRRLPSNVSAASTATFAEAPIAERSFGVFSWRDSPPSRPIRAAPMQSYSISSDEEQTGMMLFEGEEDEMVVDWCVGTPPPKHAVAGGAENREKTARDALVSQAAEHFLDHITFLQKVATVLAPAPLVKAAQQTPSPAQTSSETVSALPKSSKGASTALPPPSPDELLSSASPPPAELPESSSAVARLHRRFLDENGVGPEPDAKSGAPSAPTFPQPSASQTERTCVAAPADSGSVLPSSKQVRGTTQGGLHSTTQSKDAVKATATPTAASEAIFGSDGAKRATPSGYAVPFVATLSHSEQGAPLRKAYPARQRSTKKATAAAVAGAPSAEPPALQEKPSSSASVTSSSNSYYNTQPTARPRDDKDTLEKEEATATAPGSTATTSLPPSPPRTQIRVRAAVQPPPSSAPPTPPSDGKKSRTRDTVQNTTAPTNSTSSSLQTAKEVPRAKTIQSAPLQHPAKKSGVTQEATTRTGDESNKAAQRPPEVPNHRTSAFREGVSQKDAVPQYSLATPSSPGSSTSKDARAVPQQRGGNPVKQQTRALPTAPPPLTEFRFPMAEEEPALSALRTAATQPVNRRDAKGAAVPAPTATAPPPTSRVNAQPTQLESAAESPIGQSHVPEQRGSGNPVVSTTNNTALPPPRLAQKPPSLRPLLSQLVSRAMRDHAALDGSSVSSATATSYTADIPSSARRFHSAVATPSQFPHSAAVADATTATPPSEGGSPAAKGSRPPAPSPGNSPEDKQQQQQLSRGEWSRSSCPSSSLQPRNRDSNPPDWHASLMAGVRLHRDSPHTGRPHFYSRERSHSGGATSAWSSASPGVWDGLMRPASAERDVSLSANSVKSSPSYVALRRAGPAATAADRTGSTTTAPSRSVPSRPLLSTAVYPAFHATSVGSKYTLTDLAPAAPLLSTDEAQVIREELELQAHLNKLKAESLRQRAERYRS